MKLTAVLLCMLLLVTLSCSAFDSNRKSSKKSRRRDPEPFIVGGQYVSIKDYPFIVGIVQWQNGISKAYCGGTIITENFVLSAGHCVYFYFRGITSGNIFVRSGTTNIRGSTGYDHRIYGYVVHENYHHNFHYNDIALIKVKDPFVNMFEKPMGYALGNYTYPPKEAEVFGWGWTQSFAMGSSERLKSTKVTLLATCEPDFRDHPSWICTKGKNTSSCSGDSGGPLIQDGIVIGIVSFRLRPACATKFPSVLVKVGNFEDWIRKTMDNMPCVEDMIIY